MHEPLSPSAGHRTLAEIISDEARLLQSLKAALESEAEAIAGRDSEALLRVVDTKMSVMNELGQLAVRSEAFYQRLAAQGLDHDSVFSRWIDTIAFH